MSDDVLAMASEDVKNTPVTEELLGKIAELANKQVNLAMEVKAIEEQLKEKQKELRNIDEVLLPEAMDAVNMSEFKLTDGTKIKVNPFYSASIPAERKPEAFDWLDEHGHGGIIKTEVDVRFGKGDLEIAREFVEYARGFNGAAIEPELSQNVHAMTLKSFVKEQIESGSAIPLDLFGVFVGRKAKITLPKK